MWRHLYVVQTFYSLSEFLEARKNSRSNMPLNHGGSDQFNNLRIIHKDVHRLIRAKDKKMIDELVSRLQLTGTMIEKVNRFRKNVSFESI